MFGSAAGCLDQGTAGIQDSLEEVDNFGIALASGDFDGDGFDDLAVGAADEDLEASSDVDAGVVHVVFGTADGLTDVGDLLFDQDDFSDESAGDDDRLGMALAAGDFDADGRDDLAIGAPEENLGPAVDAGVVNVLYGSATGMTLAGNQTFSSDFPAGMPESANTDDRFGEELATGDFDGNGADDVAIGHPGEGVGSASGAGAVTVVYGLDESVGAFGTVHFVASGAVSFPELQGGRAVFVVRDGSAVPAAEVDHARTGGTATPGVDFAYTASAVDWNPGQLLPQAFFVTVNADTLDEENETIVLQLSNPSPGTALGTPTTLTFTINDDDEGGEISFDHPVFVVSEDAGLASIVIVREGGEASGVTVQFDTADLTATAGQDYSATSVVRNFAAGQSSSIVNVSVVDDGVGEGHETIQLTLTDPQGGATLGIFPTAVLVLLDDEFVFADDFEDGDTDAWSLTVP
jgi:hypothetical protein